MVECTTEELVALHLANFEEPDEGSVVPYGASVPGLTDALDVGEEAMADRFALLSAISKLKGDGQVEERSGRVRGMEGEHNAYFLTETGRARAERVRNRVMDEEIRVRNGFERTISLDRVDEYLEEPALARALARLTDDDVLYLDEGVGGRFVDRKDELALLETRLDAACDGGARTVLISGEAGIGKTTLVSELLDRAHDRGVRVLSGTCRRDVDQPYAPFREALADPLAEWGRPSPFAGGAAEDAEMFEAGRAAMFADVADFLADLSYDRPVVLFVDDLHSADESTVELFGGLADRLAGGVLVVGTYRPEDLPGDHRLAEVADEVADRHTRVDLDPFGVEETRGLVEWLLETRRVPESFVELVHDRTGGNPLFVRESVMRMVEDGTVAPEHDLFPDDPEALPVPEAVEDTIEIRLDVLDDDARDLLAHGAVIGETVTEDLLAAAVDLPGSRLREYLDVLVDSHVFVRVDDARLRFTSGVVRETVVDRIDGDRRAEIHARVAEAFEATFEEPEEHAARIAYHHQQAGDRGRALEYFLEAAERATDVYAHEVAVANYEAALSIARELDRDEEVLSILEELGQVNRIVGDYEAADRNFQYVQDFATDPGRRRRVAAYQSRMWALKGDYETAVDHAERGLSLYDGDPRDADDTTVCRLLCHLGWARMQQGAFDEARDVLDDARAIAERVGDDELLGLALHNRATVEMTQGTADDGAIETMERAIEARERAGDRVGVGGSLNNLGSMYFQQGDLERARETLERSRDTNEAAGNVSGKLSALNNLGTIYQHLGDDEAALECYDEVLPQARDIGARQTEANALASMGESYGRTRRDVATPIDYYERSLEIQRDLGNTRWLATLNRRLARLYGLCDDLDDALDRAERALELAEEAGLPAQEVSALRTCGDVHDEREEIDAAVDYHERALELARELESPESLVNTLTSTVDSYRHADRIDEARDLAREAREIAEGLPEGEETTEQALLSARLGLAQVDRDAGDYERARARLEDVHETVVDRDVDRMETYVLYELGVVDAATGDRERAREHLERARDRAAEAGVEITGRKASEELADLDADD